MSLTIISTFLQLLIVCEYVIVNSTLYYYLEKSCDLFVGGAPLWIVSSSALSTCYGFCSHVANWIVAMLGIIAFNMRIIAFSSGGVFTIPST